MVTTLDPTKVAALNADRAAVVAAGGNPNAGKDANYGTFTGDPTAADVYKGFNAPAVAVNPGKTYTGTDGSTYDSDTGALVAHGDITPVNDDQVRSNVLSQFQKEIDATNAVYAEKLAEAKQAGLGRLGSATAIAARSGTLGSDFGNAQNDKVVTANNDINASIGQEQAAAIASITGQANTLATTEIAAKRAAQTQGVNEYLKFLGDKTTRTAANLSTIAKAFIAQKVDPTTVDPTQLKNIADSAGLTTDQILASYATEKKTADAATAATTLANEKTQSEIDKSNQVTVGEGQAIYQKQPDGSYKFIAKNAKTFAPGTASGTKLTRLEVAKLGLPLSLIGQSEKDVLGQLDSKDIPAWFVEKANNDAQQTVTPDELSKLWEAARKNISGKTETVGAGSDDIEALVNALQSAATTLPSSSTEDTTQ